MRQALLLSLSFLAGAFLWAQTERQRFETTQWPITLGAGENVAAPFWVNVSKDRHNRATLYTLTRGNAGGIVEVLGFAAIGPIVPGGPSPSPTPFPTPTASPTPSPTPLPLQCDAGYDAMLEVSEELFPDQVYATFTAHWTGDPIRGVLTDNAIPIHSASIQSGQAISWSYQRGPKDQENFGFLSLWRDDGTRCDVRTDFTIPALEGSRQ